ncbi:MAG: NADH:ubiquinone oxidoreductase subunit NDUFA12 [Alphaproteobacteria bacterium]|nr:NADH:ubiquinone oxidoreductase subunit NDUFA12 [Alphaproteobacteria bacterium]
MATVGTKLHTWLKGKYVGNDEFGNKYYELRKAPKRGRHTRWVMYKGLPEASKVPAYWHGWLHYTHDAPMNVEESQRWDWQKPHLPNLSGTKYAYVPPGHVLRGAERDRAISDYEPWRP